MGAYDSAINAAASLIKRKGVKLTITRHGVAAKDPVTQIETTPADPEYQIWGVGLPPGRTFFFINPTLIAQNVVEFFFSMKGAPITPQLGDSVRFGGVDYQLVPPVTLYKPDGSSAVLLRAVGSH